MKHYLKLSSLWELLTRWEATVGCNDTLLHTGDSFIGIERAMFSFVQNIIPETVLQTSFYAYFL